MRYYVDTEFNGTEGQLISIALVRQDGAEFYAVLDMYQIPAPWVAQNVMHLLWRHSPPANPTAVDRVAGAGHHADERAVSRADCKKSLRKFLEKDPGEITFVGDWPEDIVHVNALMLRDHGKRNPPLQYRCLLLNLPGFDTASASAVPHNALEDARVLREFVEQGLADGSGGELMAADLALLQGT